MQTTSFFLRRLPGLAAMCVAAGLLAGCALQWQTRAATTGEAQLVPVLQQTSTTPADGITPVDVAGLQPGDLLFSASDGWASAGLRLFGNSAVSHAFIYLGQGEAAEAVGHGGVRIIPMRQAEQENNLLAVYRRPGLAPRDIEALQLHARSLAGRSYNYGGIARQAPYTLTRKVCELPIMPTDVRQRCLGSLALFQVGPGQNERFFCSEFVVDAFNRIGKPLTSATPAWVSPSDLLHMREGDVPAIAATVPLRYVGHLRCTPSPWNASCKTASTAPARAGPQGQAVVARSLSGRAAPSIPALLAGATAPAD